MIYSFKNSMVSSEINSEVNFDSLSKFSYKKPVIFGLPIVVISIIITLFGVNISVESAIKISDNLNIPDSFIGLSVIAIGTSLPELVTSIAAAKRKKSAIIFGNIIGSNIYNLLFILGISSLFELFNYQKKILELDVIFLSLIVTLFSFTLLKRYDINLKFSLICLFGYLFYISNLVMRNF
jgi:cation:H+ antiporter